MEGRQTTRPEDAAYCLLGLMDVHIPLLYGEGKRAMERLWKAIQEREDISYDSETTDIPHGHSAVVAQGVRRVKRPLWQAVIAALAANGILHKSCEAQNLCDHD